MRAPAICTLGVQSVVGLSIVPFGPLMANRKPNNVSIRDNKAEIIS